MVEEQKIEEQKAQAQQTLDELFKEHLLPFELSAHRIDLIGVAINTQPEGIDSHRERQRIVWAEAR